MSAQDPFSQDPIQPQQRLSGRKLLADALKNFVFSFSQGLAAQAQYPGRRGSQAGMAAALGGPQLLQQIEEQRRQQAQDQQIKLETFRQQVRQNQMQQAMQSLNAAQDRFKMMEGAPGQVVPDTDPLGGTRVLPHPAVQFPAVGTQPGYSMTPRTSQEITAPAERAAQASQVGAYNQMQGLMAAVQANPELLKSLPDAVAAQIAGQMGANTPSTKTDYSALTQAVMQNPDLFGTLSDTIQAAIAPTLTAQGFKMPTDYTPESITVNGKGPVAALRDKRGNYVDATTKKPIEGTIGVFQKAPDESIAALRDLQASLARLALQGGGLTPSQRATEINAMRTQWTKATQPILDRRSSVAKIDTGLAALASGNFNAATQTIITAFNKLQDEGSVVREGEYARSEQGQALMSRIQGSLERLTRGGSSLKAEDLRGLGAEAKAIAKALEDVQGQQLGSMRQSIEETLNDYKIPHTRVFGDSDLGKKKPQGNTVTIRAKDGTVGTIPRANLPEAIKRGAVEVK